MAKIFISYRREDSAAMAGRIFDRLRLHFGSGDVFMDIDSIPFGVNFRKHIDAAVGQCDVVLAVIGTKWAGGTASTRRLDDPRDFVRIELESALKRELPVIPILVDHAPMPGEMDLPTSLCLLADYNAIEVDQGRDFHHHVDLLIEGIESHLERLKTTAVVPLSQPQEEATSLPLAQEPAQPHVVTHTEAEKQSKATPTVDCRLDSPASTTDPALQPKEAPQGTECLKPQVQAMPGEVIESESLRERTPTFPGLQVPASSIQLVDAPPLRRKIRSLWLSAAAILLLAMLGVIIHLLTDNGSVRMSGTDKKHDSPISSTTGKTKPPAHEPEVASRGPDELSDNKMQGSAPGSTTGDTKSPDSTIKVQSPEPFPPQSGREWTNSIGMKFVRIDAGSFLMGTTKEQVDQVRRLFPGSEQENFDDEQPRHSLKISRPFSLGVYEVTRGHYQEVTHNNPSKLQGSDDLPVDSVSWLDATKFCNALSEKEKLTPFYRNDGSVSAAVGSMGYRLPTEAEWEYACRAGSVTLFPFGDEPSKLGDCAWFTGNAEGKTHPVGQQFPNAWGLYDMLGNVGEWCTDGYLAEYYASSPPADPPGFAEASHRVIRGGSWGSKPAFCRPAYRSSRPPANAYEYLGFRVAAFQK